MKNKFVEKTFLKYIIEAAKGLRGRLHETKPRK